MVEQVRIYQGTTVQSVSLEQEKSLSFGENKKCDHRFPRGSCPGNSITFSVQSGVWTVNCEGNVSCAGKPVTVASAHNGDTFILNAESTLAVQFVRQENRPAARIPLTELPELLVGRSANCTLQLNHKRVSGSHAKFYPSGDQWRLCDVNSTNGTFVNGKRIHECVLQERDVIVIGPYDLIFTNGMLEVYGESGTVIPHLPEKEERPRDQYPHFTRSPRLIRERPAGKVEIEAAPGIGSKPEINWLTVLLPSVGTLLLTLVITVVSGLSPTAMLFTGPMMLMGVVVTVLNYRSQSKKFAKAEANLQEKYQLYIRSCEEKLETVARQQRDAALYSNPAPEQCLKMAQRIDRRLWERTVSDSDFLSLRVGLGEEPLCAEIQTPKVGFVLQEDTFTRTPQQIAEKYRQVSGIPVLCDLLRAPSLGIVGERSLAIRAAQNLVIQAAVHHGYDELKLVVLFPQKEQEQWEWMRWLPHTYNVTRTQRYLACTKYDAAQVLAPLEEEFKHRANSSASAGWDKVTPQMPYYLFLVADPTLLREQPAADYILRNDCALGVSCILLGRSLSDLPRGVMQILDARGKGSELYPREHTGEKRIFQMDQLSLQDCDAFARSLAPIRLPEKDSAQLLPSGVTFLQGYHIQRPDQLDLGDYWANSCNYQSMSVPIGVRANGENFYFDIHEKKHGPHGLVAGMTGSGKSEMVQSWILSMALQFSPQDASFVLIDFKGTGLILPFLNLPHLAGTISDLDTNINRNLIALESELQRRKTLFDNAGVNNITSYLKLYRAGQVKDPLPYLFVIIDEYAEFKAKFPDFTAEINTLFRTGRSMGVHIILLTQNPAGVVSGESENNVRFRWCLKVASTAASKEVLGGHDEAAHITNPGRAYVRVGSDEVFEPVQSFYSGAVYQPDRTEQREADPTVSLVSLTGTKAAVKLPETAKHTSRGSEINAVVSYIREYTTRHHIPDARHIWQSRMPGRIFLPKLLEQVPPHKPSNLLPVIGLIDDPARQVQRPLYLPLSTDGHVAVYGAPGTGKTVLLQTLATSLCMQYSPEEVNLYIMDFGGWSMGMFRGFPQVAGIANDNEEDKITAIAQNLEIALQKRKQLFAQAGVSNLRAYLQITGEKLPYLVLLVDNFAPVYSLYPQLEDFFIKLGREGGNYGVCLVATAGSTMALGYKLNQSVKTSIALQMTDSGEYGSIVGRTNGLLPEKLPGRGLVREDRVLEFQTALPIESQEEGAYAAAIRALGEELSARWGETKADGLAVMPDVVKFGSVRPQKNGLVLGLTSDTLEPAELTPKQHHLLISGLPGSGKTTLLKALVRQVAAQDGARIVLYADPETYRSCGDGLEFLDGGAAADSFLEALATQLTARQAERKNAPNASFPAICLVVDGYKGFFEEISQQSVSRLRALVMMGVGLGVTLLAADNASALSMLVEYREPLTTLLAKGSAVLLGGRALDHMAVELPLEATEKNAPLKQFEGWYKTAEGARRFKSMNSNE